MKTSHDELDRLENTSITVVGVVCTLGVIAILCGETKAGIIIYILSMVPFGMWMYIKGYRKCLNGEAIDE